MGAFLRKYGAASAGNVYIPMIKRGVVDFAVSADWTPAAGDVKVSQDGGAAANIGTLPVAITMGNGAMWKFVFADAELQCKILSVTVVDSATKAVEDQMFDVETYGNAAAQYQADLSAANLAADVEAINGSTSAAVNQAKAANAIARGTVGASASAISIPTSALSPSATDTDQFKGKIVTFDADTATAGLRGQSTDITGSSVGGTLTVTALTSIPASGDKFGIY